MSSIPQSSFRLSQAFALQPPLQADQMSDGGLIVGQQHDDGVASAVLLGKHAERPFENVWLDIRGAHVVYVMGKRRSGKSHTLGVLAEGLVSNQWLKQGSASQAVVVLDTMNVFLTMSFSATATYAPGHPTRKELAQWRIEPAALPISLFAPTGMSVPEGLETAELALRPADLKIEEWCSLFDIDPFVDPLAHLLSEVVSRVGAEGYVDKQSGASVLPNTAFDVHELLQCIDTAAEMERYHRDTRESLRRRLIALNRLGLFSASGPDIREYFAPGRVSVFLLRSLEPQFRSMLVSLIVRRAMELRGQSEQLERMEFVYRNKAQLLDASDPQAAVELRAKADDCKRRAQEGLPRSWILIDEAHNYIPSQGFAPSRRPIKRYVDEGRNLGLSIVVATQQPSGLDTSIQRNADVLMIHSLSHRDDIRAAEGMLNADLPSDSLLNTKSLGGGSRGLEALIRNLPIGYALISTDRANRLFPARVRPRMTVHGGEEY